MRITFEGEHRSGKGTQINLYKKRSMHDPLIIRGDGSYQGGLDNILDQEDVAIRESLNRHLYNSSDQKVHKHLWSVAANLCASVVMHPNLQNQDILIDRGPLSRASFLLSTGLNGQELLNNMYPAYNLDIEDGAIRGDVINIESIDFGKIIYLKVPTSVLLERVSDDDPKADFRRKNIREKEGLFDKAIDTMPKSVRSNIEIVDGNRPPEEVYKSIVDI